MEANNPQTSAEKEMDSVHMNLPFALLKELKLTLFKYQTV